MSCDGVICCLSDAGRLYVTVGPAPTSQTTSQPHPTSLALVPVVWDVGRRPFKVLDVAVGKVRPCVVTVCSDVTVCCARVLCPCCGRAVTVM